MHAFNFEMITELLLLYLVDERLVPHCRHIVAQCELQRKNAIHPRRILVWMFFANTFLGA